MREHLLYFLSSCAILFIGKKGEVTEEAEL